MSMFCVRVCVCVRDGMHFSKLDGSIDFIYARTEYIHKISSLVMINLLNAVWLCIICISVLAAFRLSRTTFIEEIQFLISIHWVLS